MNEGINRGRVRIYGHDYKVGEKNREVVPLPLGTKVRHINTGEVFTVFSHTKGHGYQFEEGGPHYSIKFFKKAEE